MSPIRTLSEIPFEFQVFNSEPFLFQKISEKAKKMRKLRMPYYKIAKVLGVDDKTVRRAVDWIN